MRRALGVGVLVAAVLIATPGCGNDNGSNASAKDSKTTASAPANSGTDSTSQGNKNDQTDESYTPDATALEVSNPCDMTKSGQRFESEYGGTWKLTSDDNPKPEGPHYKRSCSYKGDVPGMYNGNSGPAPVTLTVTTYVAKDIQNDYFQALVKQAKDKGTYTLAKPSRDGTSDPEAFYDGEPGKSTLTAHYLAVVIQITPTSDQYDVTVNDVEHAASLNNDMYWLVQFLFDRYHA